MFVLLFILQIQLNQTPDIYLMKHSAISSNTRTSWYFSCCFNKSVPITYLRKITTNQNIKKITLHVSIIHIMLTPKLYPIMCSTILIPWFYLIFFLLPHPLSSSKFLKNRAKILVTHWVTVCFMLYCIL